MRPKQIAVVTRAIITIATPIFLALFLTGCSGGGSHGATEQNNGESLPVSITVECDSNLLFSTYDVDVAVDGEVHSTLEHGSSATYELQLPAGSHTVSFTQSGGEATGETTFSVPDEPSLRLKIHCTSSEISVEKIMTIPSPASSEDMKGQSKDEVEETLRSAGFTNVSAVEQKDLEVSDESARWTVANVTIAGSGSFAKDDQFYPDAEVVIAYHLPKDIPVPAGADELIGQNYEDVVAQFQNAGFTNVTATARGGNTPFEKEFATVEVQIRDSVISMTSDFKAGDSFPHDQEIKVVYNPEAPERAQADPEQRAMDAFEDYGKALYPYGFSCHWILDLVALQDQGDGSYYIKVGATAENEYGNKIDGYASGVVRGGTVEGFYFG